MGALIKLVTDNLVQRQVRTLDTACGTVELRGRSVSVAGDDVVLPPTSLLLFRTLFEAAGAVVSRTDLARLLAQGTPGHALDMAVNRLRRALPDGSLVQTVVKRGYRLRV